MSRLKKITGLTVAAVTLTALTVFLTSYITPREEVNKKEMLIRVLTHGMKSYHYENQSVNDDFSKETFQIYMDQIDPYKRFFLASDYEEFLKYQTSIDDEFLAGTYQFFKLSQERVDQRIAASDKYFKEILAEPFDFNKKEVMESDPDKIGYAKTEAELKDRWRKILKYNALSQVVSTLELEEAKAKQAKEDGKEHEAKSFEAIEKEVRESILKNYNEWYTRMTAQEESDWLSVYLNSFTSTYDPHTNYFPPKDKENFDISISGKLEGIGARLQDSEGYVTIAEIIAGSACWKQGDLEVGDKILKVGEADAEPKDIVGMRTDNAVQFIRGKKGTEVRLTVKKKDGTTMIIPIIRDVVEVGETYARSAIIGKKENDKTGYIWLPKFYADFEDGGGRQCATDVAEEIEKLKKENINGLIIDLRSNGGGSLRDVVDMSGLFIDKGPIVQVKGRDTAPEVLADTKSGTTYDGPLVILVNSYSASASEIMAAALQDYGRAVIIGSTSTFGKGTVQRVIDLDGFVPQAYSEVKPLGAVKLTLQKFYRINGGTTQLKGVVPDIILPDMYTYMEVGEKESKQALSWDKIDALSYTQTKSFDLAKLQSLSKKRIAADDLFKEIDASAKRLSKQKDDDKQTVNLEKYREELALSRKNNEEISRLTKAIPELFSEMTAADRKLLASDSIASKKLDSWVKSIKKDAYLHEAISVIADINQK